MLKMNRVNGNVQLKMISVKGIINKYIYIKKYP